MRVSTCKLFNKIFQVVLSEISRAGPMARSVLYSFLSVGHRLTTDVPIVAAANSASVFFDNQIRQETAVQTAQQPDTANYVYLCVTAHFWGCSKSARQARSNCRGAGGGRMLEKHGYVIYRVHPDFEVDPVHGDVRTPIGHPAILVHDKRIEK